MMKVRSKLPLLKFDELAWYFNQTWCNYSEQITNTWNHYGDNQVKHENALKIGRLLENIGFDTTQGGRPKGL